MSFNSTVKQILKNGWEKFEAAYGQVIRDVEREVVSKVLGCGDPKNGYAEYWCLECNGAERKIVPFTCKSRFCSSCGKKYTDKWVEKISNEMVDVPHRHVVVTIAEELRPYFYWHREAIEILIQSAAEAYRPHPQRNNTPEYSTVLRSRSRFPGRKTLAGQGQG